MYKQHRRTHNHIQVHQKCRHIRKITHAVQIYMQAKQVNIITTCTHTHTQAMDWCCMFQISTDSSRSSVMWETKSLSRWIHSGGSLKQTLSHQSALLLSLRQSAHGKKSYTHSTVFAQTYRLHTFYAQMHGKSFILWACIINTSMNKFQAECILHWQGFFYKAAPPECLIRSLSLFLTAYLTSSSFLVHQSF